MKPCTVNPPSMGTITPVTYELAGMHRNATTSPTSGGSPTRPMGVRSTTALLYVSFFNTCAAKGVFVYQGATALTLMLSFAHSHANDHVS